MGKFFLIFSIYYFTTESNAYAYLDPASGSIIIQYIVAGILTCMTLMKSFWSKIKYFFNKIVKFKKNKENNSNIEQK